MKKHDYIVRQFPARWISCERNRYHRIHSKNGRTTKYHPRLDKPPGKQHLYPTRNAKFALLFTRGEFGFFSHGINNRERRKAVCGTGCRSPPKSIVLEFSKLIDKEVTALKYAPKQVFILENGAYTEITYEELCYREEIDASYRERLYLPLHGMLMEVPENVYHAFYKEQRRQKYIDERSIENGDVSYDALPADELDKTDIFMDERADVGEQVVDKLLLEQLQSALSLLTEEERNLLNELFYDGISERDIAKKYGISQVAVHKRKHRIFAKLKKFLGI